MPTTDLEQLEGSARRVAQNLASAMTPEGFPDRTYYGEAFALLLWTHFPEMIDQEATNAALSSVLARDVEAPQAHNEFNNWALLQYFSRTGDDRAVEPLNNMRFRYNHIPNWTFLRILVKLLYNRMFEHERYNEAGLRCQLRKLLYSLQTPDGLIYDTRYLCEGLPIPCPDGPFSMAVDRWMGVLRAVKRVGWVPGLSGMNIDALAAKAKVALSRSVSFQYHCFDLTSLFGIYELTVWNCAKEAFRSGAELMARLVLRNGDSMYLGRGQQQLFGYGALIYTLVAGASLFDRADLLDAAMRAFRFVRQHQREDGSIPLVVQPNEDSWPPPEAGSASPAHPGWYRYNTNVFDYQAAYGLYLARAAHILRGQGVTVPGQQPRTGAYAGTGLQLFSDEIALWRDDIMEAVVSAPGGFWANAMPMPYICAYGESVMPCYGGERIPPTIYTAEMIPLPQAVQQSGERICFADRLTYVLEGNSNRCVLRGEGGGFSHRRCFTFDAGKVLIHDNLSVGRLACRSLKQISPLVFWALELEPLGHHEWRIHTAPPVKLRMSGVEGPLERTSGFSARGRIEGLRERVPFSGNRRTFEREFSISVQQAV